MNPVLGNESSLATELAGSVTVRPTIFPRSGYGVLAFLMFLNALFSIFNNFLVIAVTLKNPQLRSPLNIFILNVSFSDLMMSLCGTTVVIATNYHGFFFLGHRFCTFQGFAVNYFGKQKEEYGCQCMQESYFYCFQLEGNFQLEKELHGLAELRVASLVQTWALMNAFLQFL